MKKLSVVFIASLFLLFFVNLVLQAQPLPGGKEVVVRIYADHDNWQYKIGESVRFNISVEKNNAAMKDVEISYEISEDMMPALKKETLTLKDGKITVSGGTLQKAGFLRCQAYFKKGENTYSGICTVAYEPEKIKPTTTEPEDFVKFWETAKSEAAKIPMDRRMTLVPEKCTDKVLVYHVSIQNYQYGSRIYGMLTIPKAEGKHPAILVVPGAGIRSYSGDIPRAEKGYIVFEIGIHGIPVNMPDQVYDDLYTGALKNYYYFNLDNKDNYYYKRVIMGCIRSIDLIYSLPDFDGENVIIQGRSQGGGLSVITAALDKRIKGLVVSYPSLCDLTGYLYNRAGGGPQMLNSKETTTPEKIETSRYYDLVNFGKMLTVPGYYSFGFNDMICPPTSVYAALNIIHAPKDLYLYEDAGHYTYPEQREVAEQWIDEFFKRRVQYGKSN